MDLTRRTALRLAGAAAITPAFALPGQAQEWPSRPIRFIIGTAPGGSPDIIGRLLGERLAERLGQPVFIENVTQGAGAVAYQTVSKAPADGYTMGILTAGFAPQAALRKNLPYDPIAGFSFVTMLCGYPMVYAVAPNSPIKSFQDLLDRAKAEPGKITYTINALGSIYHVLTKWIELEAKVSMTPIPYRGTALAVTDVASGRVDVMVDAATSAFSRIQSGQLRVLALSSAGRYPLMADAPSVSETLGDVNYMSWLGLAMPPGTPRPIVDRINREVGEVLRLPEMRKRLTEGGNIATPSTPEEMRDKIAGEIARWGRVIEAGNIKVE